MSFLNRGGPLSNLSTSMLALLIVMALVMLAKELDREVIQLARGSIPAFDFRWGLISGQAAEALGPRFGDQIGWPITGWATHIFVHVSWFHLLGNAIALVSFGRGIEKLLGTRNFLVVFFASALVGGFAQMFLSPNLTAVMVGASGGVSGIIGAHFFFSNPSSKLMLFYVIPLPIRLGIVLAVIAHVALIAMGAPGVAWMAHLGGLVAGGILGVALYDPKRAMAIWQAGFDLRRLW